MNLRSPAGLCRRLARDQRGLTTVEYTIVLTLIAALCVGVWAQFGDELEGYISGSSVTIRDHLNIDGKGSTP